MARSGMQNFHDDLKTSYTRLIAAEGQVPQLDYAMEREFGKLLVDTLRSAEANEHQLQSEEWSILRGVKGSAGLSSRDAEELEYTTKDVFFWYTYHPAWRSRRRVWSAVLQGTGVARQSGWK